LPTLPAFRFCRVSSSVAIASIRLSTGCRCDARRFGSHSGIQSRTFQRLKNQKRARESNSNWRRHSRAFTRSCRKRFI
jgi:hypothetical protein